VLHLLPSIKRLVNIFHKKIVSQQKKSINGHRGFAENRIVAKPRS
jgi:hypothetical protein